MITYTIKLNQVAGLVQVDIAAPPGHATNAEIQCAGILRQHLEAFRKETKALTIADWRQPSSNRGN